MITNNSKAIKKLTILSVTVALIILNFSKAHADAWNTGKSKSKLNTSFYFSPTYKYGSTSQDSSAGNTYNSRITNKVTSKGLSASYEYGLSDKTSLIADIDLGYIDQSITVAARTNNLSTTSYSLATNYYDLNLNFGVKQNIYKDDLNVVSVEGLIYPGNFIIKHHTTHLSKKAAAGFALNYGRSFNIPFGLNTRPKYGNYIDLSGGYKFYPSKSHSEFELDASIGIRPLDDRTTFILGLYNTFKGYSYSKPPFDLNKLNTGVNSLGVSGSANNDLQNAAYQSVRDRSSYSYHQLNFQIGYDLSKAATLYLQSFHNVFKGKSFKYNSYFISLEYRF